MGHDRQIIQMDVGGLPHADFLRAIELLGTEVLPRVRAELGCVASGEDNDNDDDKRRHHPRTQSLAAAEPVASARHEMEHSPTQGCPTASWNCGLE